MEHARDWFYFTVIFYVGIGIVGYHTLNKRQEISNKLGAIDDLIRDGINKLDAIELNM
jgi:hypothetical protein